MDLSTIWYTLQDLASKYGGNTELKLYQFNNYLQLADDEMLRTKLRMKLNPSSDVEANEETLDVLEAFKKTITLTSASQALPSDYCRFAAVYGTSATIDYVSAEEYSIRKTCTITAPSATDGTFRIEGDTMYVDPASVATATSLTYYAYNTGANKPLLAFKQEEGITKYDSSSSVQLVWPEYMYLEIVYILLKYLGIVVGEPGAVQQSLMETNNVG